jgi:hypothetical protein
MVDVPPKKLPYFKVGREMKELVNEGAENQSIKGDEKVQ